MDHSLPEVRVSARGVSRLRSAHPWVFRDDTLPGAEAGNGDLVRVLDPRGRFVAWAFHSAASKIALRVASREEDPPDPGFWRTRALAALRYREAVVRDSDAFRVLFGESDGTPGLVVDRYGPHLVVQVLTAGAARILGPVLDALETAGPVRSVLARNDSSVRTLEGLPREVAPLRGRPPALVEVCESGVRFLVDLWKGQKTGAFLDQRENRVAAAAYCSGATVLDVFSYHGSFALHAARRAARVEAVDSSPAALARGRDSAGLNGLSNVSFVEANAFQDLRRRVRDGETFGVVHLDPPAFAKSRHDLPSARRGYKEINLRAMQLLQPGGILITSSCSYNLGETDWEEVLAAAAADAGRTFRVVERRGQAPDHPVRLGFPESRYLKCAILGLL